MTDEVQTLSRAFFSNITQDLSTLTLLRTQSEGWVSLAYADNG